METPAVIERYLQATAAGDLDGLVACFAPDATATDEGKTYRGPVEIRAWREQVAASFDYTTKVLSSEPGPADSYRVVALIEGNFPGGSVELTFAFRLTGDLIGDLVIG